MKKNASRTITLLFAVVATALAATGVSRGQALDAATAARIDALFARYDMTTPGVAIAVVKDGRVVYAKGYGAANLEFDRPITPKTVFQIASVSKQFTAFAVYLLEKQGRIALDDDVRKYLPELPDYGRIVRIRHLLAHTSGVRDQAALLALAGWRDGDVTTTRDVLRYVGGQKELNFEPGSRFLYSNSGYTLLAEIIRRASGETFAEFARKNIFAPLGMSDTQVGDDAGRIVRNRADSYELENGAYKRRIVNDSAEGASNVYTTVEDMAKWSLNFETAKVGGRELIARFDAPSRLDNGGRVVWGMSDGEPGFHAKGQILWNYRGVRLLSHGGHTAAYRSFHGRFPDQRLSIIALSNDEAYANFDDSVKIADLILKDVLRPAATPVSAAVRPPKPASATPDAKPARFAGRFANAELEAAYDVEYAGGRLRLVNIRLGRFDLNEAGPNKFSAVVGFPTEIEFVTDATGSAIGFKASNFGAKNIWFAKIK